MLTVETWQRVRRVYEAALAIEDPRRRDEFLSRECADDAEVRAEVASLLAADSDDTFLNPPQRSEIARAIDQSLAEVDVGRRIGPFRLERLIGSGGMGSVYLASRVAGDFEQTVAIKLIRAGAENPSLLRRFQRERQTLARLIHPNIARMYDGGITEDGRPYVVMEYVAGKAITSYCDDLKLDTSRRVRLLLAVCDAVAHAHRNLVLHCDLKPGNILVTEEGVPKLVDFGISRLMHAEDEPVTMTAATASHRFMTPEYASPEFLRSEPLTTASDVYSLGVVAYELLTGHRPYRMRSRLYHEIARSVCEEDPERPSTAINRTAGIQTGETGTRGRLTPAVVCENRGDRMARLRQRLTGDLDNILLQALRKNPAERYASVEDFADDFRRHFDGRPVQARAPTFLYRASRFIRRHKVGAAAALVVALTFIVGIAAIALSARFALQERDDALAAREKADIERQKFEQTSAFLQELLSSADPEVAQGRDLTVRELLDSASARLDDSPITEPRVEAALRFTLGVTYSNLGLYDRAANELERSLALRRQSLVAPDPALAEGLNELSRLEYRRRDFKAAEQYARDAVAMSRDLHGEDDAATATALNNLAAILRAQGRAEEAKPLYERALAIRRSLPGDHRADIAESLNNLAAYHNAAGNEDQAEPLAREALALREAALGEDHPLVIQSRANLAVLLTRQRKFDQARALMLRCLADAQRLFGENHPDYAMYLITLGRMEHTAGRHEAAIGPLRDSVRIFQATLPDRNSDMIRAMCLLGESLAALKQFGEAERVLREALDRARQDFGPSHAVTAMPLESLVGLYEASDRPADAETHRQLLQAATGSGD